ncbi:MAG: hypothetical protein HND53_08775 [Proteobacteria bacterium]|nr:hypothetical protein [Pseudomonadota bacterium]
MMMGVQLCGAVSFFFLLNELPISKPMPPEWFPFVLGLVLLCLSMANIFIEIEVVNIVLNELTMIFIIMFFGVGIYAFHSMYRRIKFKSDKL